MHKFLVAAGAASLLVAGGVAHASPQSDALGKCVVQSSTGKDRIVLVRWMFAALSANPEVAELSNLSSGQRDQINHQMVDVIERLVLKECRNEAVAAIRADGSAALDASMELFGKAAAQELMNDPAVTAELGRLDTYRDRQAWEALEDEAHK